MKQLIGNPFVEGDIHKSNVYLRSSYHHAYTPNTIMRYNKITVLSIKTYPKEKEMYTCKL